jgi:ABC-type Fe3+/spermidine/putrescine transport system ATPase subunit
MPGGDTLDGDILAIDDIQRSYGNYAALKGVSLGVRPGEFIALVGPSGCGKTTLLKLIAGFETAQSGSIRIEGRDMTGVPASQRPTSMVFQKLALFPHMTIAENIGFPLKLRGVDTATIASRVREMLELMQLKPEYLSRFPKQLSGGEQQRVALARSMISSPKLLLLDEPLSALDVKLKKVLQAELKRLHRQLGVTFVHVTHDLEEAMMLADRICVMRSGEILQIGRPNDIYYRPADAFVAGFIGDTNLLPIEVLSVEAGGIHFSGADFGGGRHFLSSDRVAPGVTAGPALLMVRPELLSFAGKGDQTDAALSARVTEMFGKGGTIQYRAHSEAGTDLVIEIPGTASAPVGFDDRIRLGWRQQDAFVMPVSV